jgi:hypothetical protein
MQRALRGGFGRLLKDLTTYGAMRLNLARAEQVLSKVAARETSEARPTAATQNDQSTTAKQQQQSAYGDAVVSGSPVSPEGPGAPLI